MHNSTGGRTAFGLCIPGCRGTTLAPMLTEGGEICFSNVSMASIANDSLFHFICSTEPCVNECFLQTIIASYSLTFSGKGSVLCVLLVL